jgi:hypothetical protein
MSEIFESLPDHPATQRVWQAVIAEDVIDFGDRCSILIPALSSDTRFTGCYWQSRDDVNTPHRGDLALAILDSNQEWWVVAWWPFQL